MRGSMDGTGEVTITFNIHQGERLEGPMGFFYLPCELCGTLQFVKEETVSVICPLCKLPKGEKSHAPTF